MDEWKALAATMTAIMTAGIVAIKIWGGKGGPKIEEINEQLDRKTNEISSKFGIESKEYKEQSDKFDDRVKQLERDHDKLESAVVTLKEKMSDLDSDTRERYSTLLHEISSLETQMTITLRNISENIGLLKGRTENVG